MWQKYAANNAQDNKQWLIFTQHKRLWISAQIEHGKTVL